MIIGGNMPKKKKIIIETEVKDDSPDMFRSVDVGRIRKERKKEEKSLSADLTAIFKTAQKLYSKRPNDDELQKKHGLYTIRSAYEYLRNRGIPVSFRAFGGRIERGNVPYVKVGRKRFIPRSVLNDIENTHQKFYTVKEAFDVYSKANKDINMRAFIGRIEKESIPSVKLGTRRLIPREAIDSLTNISSNYFSVSQAISELHKNRIKINRNAFERRLDRGRIPHSKIGGRRFIHENVMAELIDKEKNLRNN
jgi:hypothetical protein